MAVDPKKKFGADAVMPKKAISGYICFTTENLSKIKEKEGCTHAEAMKKAGQQWSSMTDKEKKKYLDMQAKDVSRYEKQMAEMNKKGFFIMEDGSKSTDHTKKAKKPK